MLTQLGQAQPSVMQFVSCPLNNLKDTWPGLLRTMGSFSKTAWGPEALKLTSASAVHILDIPQLLKGTLWGPFLGLACCGKVGSLFSF